MTQEEPPKGSSFAETRKKRTEIFGARQEIRRIGRTHIIPNFARELLKSWDNPL